MALPLDIRERQVAPADPDIGSVRRSHRDAPAPTASVMVTTRNHGHFLEEAIRALLNQDFERPMEVVVVDDDSTDQTQALMERLVGEAERPLVYARLLHQVGPGGGRNAAFSLARGEILAFTDSDCIADSAWLRAIVAAFDNAEVGVAQGRTEGMEVRTPLFEHHVETTHLDGRYATANAAFRREAVAGLRFNPACWYWEDIDLAWRVLDRGWQSAFAPAALIRHRIIPLPPLAWVLWPRHSAVLPAICAAHPGFRRHLFGRFWVGHMSLYFELAVIGAALAPWRWMTLVLTMPYAVAFARTRGVGGKFPPAKVAAYLARDVVGLVALLGASFRRRALVL